MEGKNSTFNFIDFELERLSESEKFQNSTINDKIDFIVNLVILVHQKRQKLIESRGQ